MTADADGWPLFQDCDDDEAKRQAVEVAVLAAIQEQLIDRSGLPTGVRARALHAIVFASPTFQAFVTHAADSLITAERAGVEAQAAAAIIKAAMTK